MFDTTEKKVENCSEEYITSNDYLERLDYLIKLQDANCDKLTQTFYRIMYEQMTLSNDIHSRESFTKVLISLFSCTTIIGICAMFVYVVYNIIGK